MTTRLFSSYLVSVSGPETASAVHYARTHGYGIEIKDFAWHGVLTDRRLCKQVMASYRGVLPSLAGPITAHGPFTDLSLGGSDPGVLAISRKRVAAFLDVVEALAVPRAVLHTCWNHPQAQPWYRPEWVKRHAEFWQEALKGRRVEVLLENLWDPDPELFAMAVDAVGMTAVAACLDVGHAHVHTGIPPQRWVEVLGSRIRHLHLHDNTREYDQHLTPGAGSVEWAAVAHSLRTQGLRPTATLELGLEQLEEATLFLEGL